MSAIYTANTVEVRDVYADNLTKEFDYIKKRIDEYPNVIMDTEFPGAVINTGGDSYFILKSNVNMLKLIQLGLTLCDDAGNLPISDSGKYIVWQFNFKDFNPNTDTGAPDSVQLLRDAGINFEKNAEEGIDAVQFGELLVSSALVLNDDINWITFHGSSDFGYLIKILTAKNLPESQAEFLDLLKIYFPVSYDVRYLTNYIDGLYGGLEHVAKTLSIKRVVGKAHQAGSDSFLTFSIFMKVKDFLQGTLENYSGVVYGLQL